MSAANPKLPEPSMEEILASIRRIIADDQESVKTPGSPHSPAAPKPPVALASVPPFVDEDVLDLAEVAPPKPNPAQVPLELEVPEVGFRDDSDGYGGSESREIAPEPEPPRPPRREPPVMRRPDPPAASNEDHLISSTTDQTVGQAFNLLANTVLGNSTRTLEDLVREMLRPMLKNWLDDNLPTIVERLVRAEIERVARGK